MRSGEYKYLLWSFLLRYWKTVDTTAYECAFFSWELPICSSLWDIQCQRMTWPWKPGSGSCKVIENGAVR